MRLRDLLEKAIDNICNPISHTLTWEFECNFKSQAPESEVCLCYFRCLLTSSKVICSHHPEQEYPFEHLTNKHYVWPLISIATDNVNSDTPAINKLLYICTELVGTEPLLTDVYDMKMGRHLMNMLEDVILQSVPPTKLIRDHAQVELATKSLKFSIHLTV